MSNETQITLIGNLVEDVELRFTPSGHAVANFTVASTSRVFDKEKGEYKDGDAIFLRCSIWRQYAENITESLAKGTRVIVTGRLKQKHYETKEGEKRTSFEVDVDEVGAALRYATVKITKTTRDNKSASQTSNEYQGDPWAAATNDDTPPF